MAHARSQCAYSSAARPTPPAPACTTSCAPADGPDRRKATWTVLHVVGSVHAASAQRVRGLTASSRESERARDASAPIAYPTTSCPSAMWGTRVPSASTRPAQSAPGSPGSPGYTPSTLRTSRKFRPTDRTANSASPATQGGERGA
eukprot:scaffold22390_cov28-Tisochrysis_lutea.AAC.7